MQPSPHLNDARAPQPRPLPSETGLSPSDTATAHSKPPCTGEPQPPDNSSSPNTSPGSPATTEQDHATPPTSRDPSAADQAPPSTHPHCGQHTRPDQDAQERQTDTSPRPAIASATNNRSQLPTLRRSARANA